MSFTTQIKHELSNYELKDCCKKSQLSALLLYNGILNIHHNKFFLEIRVENVNVVKKIWKLIKELYDINCELAVSKKLKLKKNNIYILRLYDRAIDILDSLNIYKNGIICNPNLGFLKKDCCIRSYLAGVFMSKGSCNAPTKSDYHLEMTSSEFSYSKFVRKLILRYNINCKLIKRRNDHVVYIKAAQDIGDFLKLVKAYDSLLSFENIRINKDFINSITRLDNCEGANEIKVLNTADRHLEDINFIEKHQQIDFLNSKLKQVVVLRKKFPEASLLELTNEYESLYGNKISKSGLKHRFDKLNMIVRKLKEDK